MFTEILPATASGKPSTMYWTPVRPGVGVLEIVSKRQSCRYAVSEFETPFDGRAVRMVKSDATPGTDAEEGRYDVYCSEIGEHACGCKGFTAHRTCKHVAALEALIGNGWLNLEAEVTLPTLRQVEDQLNWEENQPQPKPEIRMVWCENDRTCGGVGVPGYQLPGSFNRTLCVKCFAIWQAEQAVEPDQFADLPGYAEYADAIEAALNADPDAEAKMQAHDDKQQEILMKAQADAERAARLESQGDVKLYMTPQIRKDMADQAAAAKEAARREAQAKEPTNGNFKAFICADGSRDMADQGAF